MEKGFSEQGVNTLSAEPLSRLSHAHTYSHLRAHLFTHSAMLLAAEPLKVRKKKEKKHRLTAVSFQADGFWPIHIFPPFVNTILKEDMLDVSVDVCLDQRGRKRTDNICSHSSCCSFTFNAFFFFFSRTSSVLLQSAFSETFKSSPLDRRPLIEPLGWSVLVTAVPPQRGPASANHTWLYQLLTGPLSSRSGGITSNFSNSGDQTGLKPLHLGYVRATWQLHSASRAVASPPPCSKTLFILFFNISKKAQIPTD